MQLKVLMILTDPDKSELTFVFSCAELQQSSHISHSWKETWNSHCSWEDKKACCCWQQVFDRISGLYFTLAILATLHTSVFLKAYLHPQLAESSLTTGQCLNLETQCQEHQLFSLIIRGVLEKYQDTPGSSTTTHFTLTIFRGGRLDYVL